MRFLRSVAGYRRTYKKRNTDIRQKLKIFNLRQKIRECHRNFFGHILRMPTHQIPWIKYSITTHREEEIRFDHGGDG
jgi:hypothetical protein